MYICIYIYIYIYMYVCIYIYIYIFINVFLTIFEACGLMQRPPGHEAGIEPVPLQPPARWPEANEDFWEQKRGKRKRSQTKKIRKARER